MTKPLPSQQYLQECFSYNQETGDLICGEYANHG